jgi:hypothetical protein
MMSTARILRDAVNRIMVAGAKTFRVTWEAE